MAAITYTAIDRGNLMLGHVAEVSYSFDVGVNQWDPIQNRKKNDATSLSGIRETLLHRIDKTAKVSTVPLKAGDIKEQMREFFLIDPYGSVATPSNPVTASLEGDSSESRHGRSDTHSFAFKIRL